MPEKRIKRHSCKGTDGKAATPLKVNSVPGWDVGPDEIKAKQKEDDSLKKYCDLVGKPVEVGKPQFVR